MDDARRLRLTLAPVALAVALLAAGSVAPLAGQAPDSAAPAIPDSVALSVPDSILPGPGLLPAARVEIERQLAARPIVFRGDVEIPRDSLLPRAVLVLGGTLRFQGRTPGTVMVVGGDLFLRPGAEIGGDVVVIGGGFYGSGLATVSGQKRVIHGEKVAVLQEPGAAGEPESGQPGRPGPVVISAEREPRPFPVALQGLYGFLPEMYNRIDGLALRWGVRYVPPRRSAEALRLSAQAIVRTSRDEVGWLASAVKPVPSRRLVLRGAWYNVTDTSERWHRGDVETSLATFFLGEDNRFYFDRRGIELRAEKEVHGPLSLDAAFRNDTYRSVSTQDPFTVAEDDFLPNPPVPEGTMRSVLAGATWEGRDDPESPALGWWGRLEGEATGGFLEGDYAFSSARLDLRRYQPVGPHQLDARLVVGGRIGGTLPQQKRYHLGGAATLPGYEALEVRGDRAALLNLRYRVPLPVLRRFGLFREGAWLALLADAGDAWESEGGDPDWLASTGVGVTGRGPLSEVGVYLVVPSERISPDQSDVSVFLYFGRFF